MEIYENILFKGINKDDCMRMIDCFHSTLKSYENGELIPSSYVSEHRIGIVLKGNAVVVKYDINGNRTIFENLEKNSVFGELFTFTNSERSSFEIICESDCTVVFIAYSEITKRCSKACKCHSMVVENMLELLSSKTMQLSERIEVLTQRTTTEKLMSYLNIIEEKTPRGIQPEIPFSTTALSDYLCVNRSALQREISKLKSNGVLKLSKRKFKIINYDSKE